MVADSIIQKRFTIEEYLDLEEKSLEKHEFHNGEIIKVEGASFNHNKIVANIIIALGNALDEREECSVLPSDIKIHIPRIRRFVYPDAVVICEEPEFYEGRKDTILNPLLIVEVLSDGTDDYDKEGKFLKYSMIPSFKEYVLVSQDESFVTSFYKKEGETWEKNTEEGISQSIHLQSLSVNIALKAIYKGINLTS